MANATNLSSSDLESLAESDRSNSSSCSNRSLPVAEKERRKKYLLALKYFSQVEAGTPIHGNKVAESNLVLVEELGLSQGLPPEGISVMLEFAMSLRMGSSPCTRVFKCLIPASVVPQEAVVRGVSWLCVGKISISTKILFLKWVLTMFDMIDCKDQLRSIYGFIFNFVTEESLTPFVCHLLYLLTRKESVRVFRVRKLLDLQSKMGKQPFLSHLLSLYKVFCPELVTLSLPPRMKTGFRNHNGPWKAALSVVQKSNAVKLTSELKLMLATQKQATSRKRKLNYMELPVLSAAIPTPTEDSAPGRTGLPLVQLTSFSQLLENLHRIELPSQMGSLLGSSLALHYIDCVQDSSAFLRLNYWLGHSLHEEFLFRGDGEGSQDMAETVRFLGTLLSTHNFLQEAFLSTEAFLYKFLNTWDGSLLRPQILGLLSDIPMVPSSCIRKLLFEPLRQLFFTSTLFFKCSVLECLNTMLGKWLTWHSVYAQEEGLDISLNSHTPINMTLSSFMDSVMELVKFVGHLATVGLQLEGCHTLLLNFVLDFYETVCDMFLKYGLPLVVMPPAGVFYPLLLATDPITVDRLGYIMYKYKQNLISAKSQEQKTKQAFHISRQIFCEFNRYLLFMVNCLWSSKMFQPGTAIELDEELLLQSGVPDYQSSFNFVHHPAFVYHAIDFHRQCWPDRRNTDISIIKAGKQWDWYLEYLFTQGLDGLKLFIQSNIRRRSTSRVDHGDS